jgi:hypothetical protein
MLSIYQELFEVVKGLIFRMRAALPDFLHVLQIDLVALLTNPKFLNDRFGIYIQTVIIRL